MLFIYFQGKIFFTLHLFDLVILNFHFDVVPRFYLLKSNHYVSACENFPNSSCHFWKYKSVFLQVLHQSSVPSNITPKVQMFESFNCSGRNISNSSCEFWNDKLIPLRNFTSFFIVMTHISSVNFKLIHFVLWIKGSHQSPNFETFECSGENLPNSSCHGFFSNHNSVFLQILYHSSVVWKIILLYFLSSDILYFGQKEPVKVQIFEAFECLGQNSSNSSC